jgi:hypothetical protein
MREETKPPLHERVKHYRAWKAVCVEQVLDQLGRELPAPSEEIGSALVFYVQGFLGQRSVEIFQGQFPLETRLAIRVNLRLRQP